MSSVLVAPGTFWCKNAIYDAYKLKDTHTKYLYECLSTVISTVLSVQVYYYIRKNITTFKTEYFTYFKQNLFSLIIQQIWCARVQWRDNTSANLLFK